MSMVVNQTLNPCCQCRISRLHSTSGGAGCLSTENLGSIYMRHTYEVDIKLDNSLPRFTGMLCVRHAKVPRADNFLIRRITRLWPRLGG